MKKDTGYTSYRQLRRASRWKRSVRLDLLAQFRSNKTAIAGAVVVGIFLVLALIAPWISPYNPDAQNLAHSLQAPSMAHWLGTDQFGRDELSRVLYGSRVSLGIGIASIAVSLVVGGTLGVIAGFFGGWVDMIISRLFDIMLGFPSILLAIAIVAILGPGLFNALLAISVINVPSFGRLIRSQVLTIKRLEYVDAAHSLGIHPARIMFRHVMPNALSAVMVRATLGVGLAILETAGLSFLGLGAQPPTPAWGAMLANAMNYMAEAPWLMIAPGAAIGLCVLGFSLLGDGLLEVLRR
jgi:peptide/nickel transport system permease protein